MSTVIKWAAVLLGAAALLSATFFIGKKVQRSADLLEFAQAKWDTVAWVLMPADTIRITKTIVAKVYDSTNVKALESVNKLVTLERDSLQALLFNLVATKGFSADSTQYHLQVLHYPDPWSYGTFSYSLDLKPQLYPQMGKTIVEVHNVYPIPWFIAVAAVFFGGGYYVGTR